MNIDKKIKLLASTEYDLDIISHLCQDAILSKEEFFFGIKRAEVSEGGIVFE